MLTFGTPEGLNCKLQHSADLQGEWQTIHELTGAGGRVDVPYEVPDGIAGQRSYFRVLYSN